MRTMCQEDAPVAVRVAENVTRTVRAGAERDIPAMVEMGRRFLASSRYEKHLADNPEQMAALVRKLLNGEGGVLIAERRGFPVGMLGYVLYDHFISGEKVCGEVFWWVEPEHRGDGLRLLKALEEIARESGARKLQMIAPDARVANVYQRLGYDFLESSYQKSL